MLSRLTVAVGLASTLASVTVAAHHSFAVFFDDTKNIEVRGAVTDFRFTNPHGVITITGARTSGGAPETWRAETNAPTILTRRGWSATSLKKGDVITIEGWPSRDGKNYIRMRRVVRADGTVLGAPAAAPGTDPTGEKR
jgi:Family of unknown function (DUF6152)